MERFRAALAAVFVVGVVVAAPAVSGTSSRRAGETRQHASLTLRTSLDVDILNRINVIRVSRGLVKLAADPSLRAAATLHTREMARAGLFEHESPNGSAFWKRVTRFYPGSGYRSWAVGETLLWWSPDTTAENTVRAWLESPLHREILLDPRWRQVGVAAMHDTAAPGDFGDQEATIVTADFGVRAR